jgi:hydrophobic/amphiphilic exporter-1 (mainly G- bacteria), HAE1 family
VGAVTLFGGQEREVQVLLDYPAMTGRGLTIGQVREALLGENRNTRGGAIDEGKKRYLVRTLGQFTDLKQIEDVIIANRDGSPVYVRDIATVRFGLKEHERSLRQRGEPSVGFVVVRRTGANTVEVMQRLTRELDYLNTVYADKDIRFEQIYDETDYIYDAVRLLTNNFYEVSFLTIVVLLFFLRSISSILVIALSIPVSVISTFIILYALGRSLNMIMLAGLAFAVGNVVDNSIVVLENIVRHREMGKSRVQAALDGASEVWGAILASTLTNIAVFLPIILLEDEVGQLFQDIAIATSISTVLSLGCALTIVPMMASRLLRARTEGSRYTRLRRLLDVMVLSWVGSAFSHGLVHCLLWLRRGVGRRLVVVLGMTLGSLFLAVFLMPPIDYLPKGNRNIILAVAQLPPGSSLEQIDGILSELEHRYMQMPEIAHLFAVVRTRNPLLGVIVKREYADVRGIHRVIEDMKQRSTGIPGTQAVFITQMPLFRQGGQLVGGTNLEIDVKGHGLNEVRDITAAIERQVRALPEVNFVRSSFEWGNPELQVAVDRRKASDLGLSVSEAGYILETLVAGTLAGTFREQGKERDLTLIGSERGAARIQMLDNVVLYPLRGGPVRLADIATIREAEGPTKIEHIDRDRATKLTVNLHDKVSMQEAIDTVNAQVLHKIRQDLPLGYTINISGHAEALDRTWTSLKWSFLLAVVVIYLLMCSLYESFTYPFIILFSVPPALVGGVLGVRILHAIEPSVKLDVVTMLGFIIMAGVVANAAILLVEQALHHMQEGMHPQDAIIESARNRLRPIFMTASSILGFLPLVASSGAGSELYRGMGAVQLGGMALSTMFTLVLVPTLFSLWMDAKFHLPALLGKKPLELNGNGHDHDTVLSN